ncbi:MAG: hypothetical protein H6624_17050 [Bdellovibrionaceae bacterium]|nr:hypothetical protein [Bdellovibrionales bacterium]MCB9086055.1 hypothetical protein [Pseudobdellovibrionaceae bacterium]
MEAFDALYVSLTLGVFHSQTTEKRRSLLWILPVIMGLLTQVGIDHRVTAVVGLAVMWVVPKSRWPMALVLCLPSYSSLWSALFISGLGFTVSMLLERTQLFWAFSIRENRLTESSQVSAKLMVLGLSYYSLYPVVYL